MIAVMENIYFFFFNHIARKILKFLKKTEDKIIFKQTF